MARNESRLIDADDCVLVLVDVQPIFLDKLAAAESEVLLERIVWLVGVARWAGIPVLAMAEDVTRNGGIHQRVADALGEGAVVHDKQHFGLTAEPAIADALRSPGKGTAILVGLETDVCVCQSALGLLDEGFRAVVVADAVGSPGPDHAYGLQRMRAAGVTVTGLKGLFYEWMRTVARTEQFHAECDATLGRPAGVRL